VRYVKKRRSAKLSPTLSTSHPEEVLYDPEADSLIEPTEMSAGKRKRPKISLDRWITLVSGVAAVVGWALLIMANMPGTDPQPPTIQDFHLSQETVEVGETISAKVIVYDPNLPDDEIQYFWAAQLGQIGEQLNRFEGPQVTYVAPDQPGVDFITIIVNDREGATDRDFRTITITERRRKELIVGNKDFAEQYIVGQLMKQLLEDRGFAVTLLSDLYSPDLRRKMEDGDIDICADYTGTVWMAHLEHEYEPGIDNNRLYGLVKEEDEDNGIIWLKPMWNNNTYALASWSEFIEEHGLDTLSDLATLYREREGKVETFVDTTFLTRVDGLPGLEKHYDFEVDETYIMTGKPGVSLEGLAKHMCNVAMVFGTDAEIAQYGWHVYMDDKAFFPPYDLTPCVRTGVLDRYPEIAVILNELVASFPGGGQPATTGTIAECQKIWQELNAKVNIDGMDPDEVAREYLVEHGLIEA
jgi:osmoprotectant transport system substrate-binding protein